MEFGPFGPMEDDGDGGGGVGVLVGWWGVGL